MVIRQALSAIKRSPSTLWSKYVGRMHSRNNILIDKGRAYLSSSGRIWNAADDMDGVRCIDLHTGDTVWFFNSSSDANEISFFGSTIIFGTDAGDIYALDKQEGAVISKISVGSAVYSRAISVTDGDSSLAVILSSGGDVVCYNAKSKSFDRIDTLPFSFRANPETTSSWASIGRLLAGAETGELLRIDINGGKLSSAVLTQEKKRRSSRYNFDLEVVSLSSFIITGDRVVVSYARNTTDERPPISCYSLEDGRKIWDGGKMRTVSKREKDFGNSRIRPVIWRDEILSTFSYNADLHSFSLETGKWLWKVRLDKGYFQNWASPVLHDQKLYIGRVNGVLTELDMTSKKIIETNSIDIINELPKDRDDEAFDWNESWPKADRKLGLPGPGPNQIVTAGICATPAADGHVVLVGTVSGNLVCLPG